MLSSVKRMISPARLLRSKTHLLPGQFLVTELSFSVPLDYRHPTGKTLQLFGRSVIKFDRPIIPVSPQEYFNNLLKKPWLVYLEGGPGFGNQEPQNMPLTKAALGRGYQVLYLDYRGTGLSTPVTADLLESLGDAQTQADYLKLFRQDNIVRDLEAVRLNLTADYPEDQQQWSLFGQSFGGFVSLTYLSKHPEGLREVFLTGGLAPLDKDAEQVYEATYGKVVERNETFYKKYPEDAGRLVKIAAFLSTQKDGAVPLPSGGALTLPRLLTLGQVFGSHGGLDVVHAYLVRLATDIEQFGRISRPALVQIEQAVPFDCAPIYAILHEPIYCYKSGLASRWAAQRVGARKERFWWLAADAASVARTVAAMAAEDDQETTTAGGSDVEDEGEGEHQEQPPPPFFSGEMIYPLHFETYPELARMKVTADLLADFDGWEELYDEGQLAVNEVPVYAASFIDDMYVDYDFARETSAKVRGVKVFETNAMYHNALRARSDEVLMHLFRLRDDTID